MSHVDPLLWIPLGSLLAVVFVWVALDPPEPSSHNWDARIIGWLVGERLRRVLLRVFGVGLALAAGWYVYHGVLALLAG